MLDEHTQHDCLIIGAGPAGLSAAIYMGRFLRKTLVVDDHHGRSTFAQVNDNYLGFPEGIEVLELRARGQRQAERFGAKFVNAKVSSLTKTREGFEASTDLGLCQSTTVILCTGVKDRWPDIENVESYVGKSLFWCITCDGFRAFNRRLVLFGGDDEAAVTACQFRMYTEEITLVVPTNGNAISPSKKHELIAHGIDIVQGEVTRLEGSIASPTAAILRGGERVPGDIFFSLLGCEPNNLLAKEVGIECDALGYIKVDQEGYTSVPGAFCGGDISRMHTHQAIAAAHEGAEAAQTANYWLYSNYQRNEPARFTAAELKERVRSSG